MTGVVFIFWAGFISAISFMEAWIKFRAEGVTKEIGLSIGKKVFTALNRMEWLFFLISMVAWLITNEEIYRLLFILMVLIGVILAFQSLFSLPGLKKRASDIIKGRPVKPSAIHAIHGVLEVLKVILLLVAAAQWFISLT